MVTATLESRPSEPIIVCPENDDPSSLRSACLLCGAYLLLIEEASLELVLATFHGVLQSISGAVGAEIRNEPIVGCWRALDRACALRWLAKPSDGPAEPALDTDMASHYAHPANGGVHVLVPGKLLLAPPPALLPAGQEWADATAAAGGPAVRRFGAGFLADLLADLDVSAVVCLGRSGEGEVAAWGSRGLDVHGLGLDARWPALLGGMDRLLAVSRAAPGGVALVGGGERGAAARTLGSALLVREYGFDGDAAEAWVRLMCPSLIGPVSDASAE